MYSGEPVKHKNYIQSGKYKGLPSYFSDEVKELILHYTREVVGKLRDSDVKKYGKYKFNSLVTLNPNELISGEILRSAEKLTTLIKSLKNLTSLKWINNIKFTVEQRSVCKPYKGLHIHMLINQTQRYKKSYIIRSIYTRLTSKKFIDECGIFIDTKNSINVRLCNNDDNYNRCLEYIRGNKEECKSSKVALDKLFRTEYKLIDLYEVGNKLEG